MPSWQEQIKVAAVRATGMALQEERARCAWLCGRMVTAAQHKKVPEAFRNVITETMNKVINSIRDGTRPDEPILILRQPTLDVGRLQTRCSELIDVLTRLGWEGEATIRDIHKQISEWREQEDRIDELEELLEKYREHDEKVSEVLDAKEEVEGSLE